MSANNNLSNDTSEKIKAIILKLMVNNSSYSQKKFTSSQLQQLSKQMANGTQINQEEIIGLYDASIANSFSGNFSGILFLNDKIYVNLHKSPKSGCMQYADMSSLTGDPSSFFATFELTSNDGNKIILKGLSYTTPKVYAVFEDIIKTVNEFKRTSSSQKESQKLSIEENPKEVQTPKVNGINGDNDNEASHLTSKDTIDHLGTSSTITKKEATKIEPNTEVAKSPQTLLLTNTVVEEKDDNSEEKQFFTNKLPSFIKRLKKNLKINLNWTWHFVGDTDFASIMSSVRQGRLCYKNDEFPVAFHDESIFGNKKSGILITTKRIYHVTAFQSNMFALTDSESVCSFRGTVGENEPYCRIKWCSEASNVDISGEHPSKAHNVLLFWGNLFGFLITKQDKDITTSTQSGNNVKIFSLSPASTSEISGAHTFPPHTKEYARASFKALIF